MVNKHVQKPFLNHVLFFLNFHFSSCFIFSFTHILGIVTIWLVYILGGVDYDQEPKNRPDANYVSLAS